MRPTRPVTGFRPYGSRRSVRSKQKQKTISMLLLNQCLGFGSARFWLPGSGSKGQKSKSKL